MKSKFQPTMLSLLALFLPACLHNGPGATVEGNRAVRPGWIPAPNRSHPDLLYVTGGCRDQGSMAEARTCALRDAEQQIQQQLGGSQPVQIKGAYVKDEHSERRYAAAGEVRDYWVLVAYPRRELAREETRIANRVLLGVVCSADTGGACDPRYPEQLEAGMTRGNMAPAPQRLAPAMVGSGAALDDAIREAARQRAARLLLVTLSAKFLSSIDGEFYAESRCGYRLIDAVSGKVQSTYESGPVKGGHIARQPAVRKALDQCVKQVAARLAQ